MTHTKLILSLIICSALALSALASAKDNPAQAKSPAQPSAQVGKPETVSAEKIRAALRSPDEDVYQTSLGTLVIRRSDDTSNTPGKIFLNGELIYTARSEELIPHLRGRPFNLRPISFDSNDKKLPHFRITKMVVEESSYTCQYIVLDFTGPKVWISERFPKKTFQGGECVDMTWVIWEKRGAFFYFGDDARDWSKDGYHGWVAGYNPKLKKVLEPVNLDAPLPPKGYSLVPKPTHLLEAERKGR